MYLQTTRLSAQFIAEQIEPFYVYIGVDWHLWLVYLSSAAKIIVPSDAHAQRAEMEPNHASTSFSFLVLAPVVPQKT